MDGVNSDYDDCRVLVATLRSRVIRHGHTDQRRLRAEIGQLIDLMETIGPPDEPFRSRLDAARSLVVLERLSAALDRVDALLSAVRRAGPAPRWKRQ
ncbi:hypothetical protein A6V36_33135 [Paraburkholderia ginsengiterrae]|uniref:Uncharacterized protein n=2 Tax=Paraburkholderia ginsengiterrae TaxID=1462993 RepID=A0A1A9N3E3_9BURK|nr:hypothetical protein [Paraburkholderia ginsengiterrae]OAJ56743.1 hypothetical protein A6V36_33135 [Paraburkholderia ginsengiterrae]OAJ57166.1 hypothetical protein A6V37_29880 [Paraburkholderia ginsengiterrae]